MSDNLETIIETPPIVETVPDEWGSINVVLLCIGCCILQNVLNEVIMYYNVYRHEDYNELIEKTRNLGTKLKKLKDQ